MADFSRTPEANEAARELTKVFRTGLRKPLALDAERRTRLQAAMGVSDNLWDTMVYALGCWRECLIRNQKPRPVS